MAPNMELEAQGACLFEAWSSRLDGVWSARREILKPESVELDAGTV